MRDDILLLYYNDIKNILLNIIQTKSLNINYIPVQMRMH